jgi:hypothetical protein
MDVADEYHAHAEALASHPDFADEATRWEALIDALLAIDQRLESIACYLDDATTRGWG